ncbi:hypothetical protein [Piscinibacter sakaiensis]|uniref:hypothetical protein n=1 Tax=Piscinibacter sakaiensis TaxID=1547922 RepID=UPI003AAEA09A
MTDPIPPGGGEETAEYIPFEEFRNGLPFGRFRVIVNPVLARRFVAQRTHATPLAIAIIGIGIATALAGHVWTGALLVAVGVLLRRAVRWQADKILLHLTSRHESTYLSATTQGVMEVQRS